MLLLTYRCSYCGRDYERLSFDGHRHPQEDIIPCFDCARNSKWKDVYISRHPQEDVIPYWRNGAAITETTSVGD